jgi:hypothetical protein
MSDDMEGDKRVKAVMDLIPSDWDKRPLILATEIRKFLQTICDQGTSVDSGGGDNCADLWPIIGGVEYYISIRAKSP